MNYTEFQDADPAGLGGTVLTVNNNPAPTMITLGGGRTLNMIESNQGIIYVWDGDSAVRLAVIKTVGMVTTYRIEEVTQDAAEFAALVDD